MGATDVLPFVPVGTAALDGCVQLAQRAGERIGSRLGIPVFLYEAAATRPTGRIWRTCGAANTKELARAIRTDPDRAPDFRSRRSPSSAGATAVGARLPLLAFNVNLRHADVEIMKKIAKAIRFQTGGLRYVKALGFARGARRRAGLDEPREHSRPPVHRSSALIRDEAERAGVPIVGSEVVGLVCQDALVDVWACCASGFSRATRSSRTGSRAGSERPSRRFQVRRRGRVVSARGRDGLGRGRRARGRARDDGRAPDDRKEEICRRGGPDARGGARQGGAPPGAPGARGGQARARSRLPRG